MECELHKRNIKTHLLRKKSAVKQDYIFSKVSLIGNTADVFVYDVWRIITRNSVSIVNA